MRFSSPRTRGRPLGALRLALAAAVLVPFAAVAPAQPAAAQARTLTVATDGSDSGPGTVAAPCAPSNAPSIWPGPAP